MILLTSLLHKKVAPLSLNDVNTLLNMLYLFLVIEQKLKDKD